MRLLRWKLVVCTWVVIGTCASWAVAAEPGPLDLSAASGPGLCGMFGKLKAGPQEFDGISFDVKDAYVHVPLGQKKEVSFPEVKCAALHFLHFTESAGDHIGVYSLIYADGQRAEISLRGGLNIQDWWKTGRLAFAAQAHTDTLPRDPQPQPIGFWRFSTRNPRPDVPLTGIEVVNSDAAASINLVAVTLTAACGDKVGDVPIWANGMDEEQFFLAALAQPGPVAGKDKACEELKRVGTLKSVPALAACLTDEKLSHAARLALTAMAYPEAHAALRDALGATTGATKAGIIESLGALRSAEYAPLIAPSLRDGDPVIAMSAALALGRIGGPVSVKALKEAAPAASGRFQKVILDALLHCAESLRGKHDRAAYALYSDIYKQWGKEYVGTAAYEGMIRTGGGKAKRLIADALLGDDPALVDAALPTIRDTGKTKLAKKCADLLGRVAKPVVPGLIEALAQRGDKAVGKSLAPFADDSDPAVAGVAIKALALVGDGSSVPALVAAAAHGDERNRPAAMQALAQLNAPDVSESLLARLKGSDAGEAAVLAKVMGQRRDKAVGPALRQLVQTGDTEVRAAAVQALAEVGEAEDADLLCQMVEQAKSDKERGSAKRALVTLGNRLGAPAPFVQAILGRLGNGSADVRCAMLGVSGKLRNAELLHAMEQAAGDANASVKDAAIRALAESDNPNALACQLAVLGTTADLTQRVLLFRGIATLASNTKDIEEPVREDALTRALAASERPEEKKLFLGALGSCPTKTALKIVETYLPANEVAVEAITAWGMIAKPLLATSADEVRATAPGVVAKAKEVGMSRVAMEPLMEVVRVLAATPVPASKVHFEHVVIDKQFRAEGIAVADVNRDGLKDLIVGDLWFSAPDWQSHEIRKPETYDGNTGYSHCFLDFAMDVDDDGWVDSIEFGGPGAPAFWYRNPGEAGGLWPEHLLASSAAGETFIMGDLVGDGKPVLIFGYNKRIAWARPGQDKTAPWPAVQFSHMTDLGHGLGMGDLNGDGRMDVLTTDGWLEGPLDRSRPDWGFHPVPFGPACANMLVYDVNGDGANDVITSSAHDYGMWWFEQTKEGDKTVFNQHEIFKGMSQTHALILADINNDGLPDLVTGKRYYAHCGHDLGAQEPAMLCWFELKRPEPGKVEYVMHEIDKDSGVGTQFEVCDVDGDGLLDIAVSNKKGVHLFLQRRDK